MHLRTLGMALLLSCSAYAASPEAVSVFEKGLSLFQKGDRNKAEKSFREAVSIDPDYAEARYYLTQLLYERRETTEAMTNIEIVIAGDPAWLDAYVLRGKIFVLHGWTSRAIADFERVISTEPKNSEALYELSGLLMDKGAPEDISRAEELLHRALGAKPVFAEARELLGEIQLKNGDIEGALDSFRNVNMLKPSSSLDRKISVLEIMASGISMEDAEAIVDGDGIEEPETVEQVQDIHIVPSVKKPEEKVEENSETESESSLIWMILSAVVGITALAGGVYALKYGKQKKGSKSRQSALQLEGNDKPSAIEEWEKVLTVEPEDLEALTHLMNLYNETGSTRNALNMSEKLSALEPRSVKHIVNSMSLYAVLNEYTKLDAAIDRALKLSRNSSEVLLEGSKQLLISKQYEKARAHFDHLLKRDPDMTENVVKEIEGALQVDRGAEDMHEYLAELMCRADNAAGAVHHYEQMLERKPDSTEIMEKIAATALMAGLPQKAADMYASLIDIRPGNADYHFTLANILEELKKFERAVKLLRKISDKFPDHADRVKKAMTRLIEKNPTDATIREGMVEMLVEMNELREARFHLEALVELKPTSTEYADRLLRLQIADGDIEGALRTLETEEKTAETSVVAEGYREMMRKYPEESKAIRAYGAFLERAGEPERAAKLYSSILAKTPGDFESAFRLGAINIKNGNVSEALVELTPLTMNEEYRKKTIDLFLQDNERERHPLIRVALAEAYAREGSKEMALPEINAAVEALTKDPGALRKAARVFEMIDDYDGAVRTLKLLVRNTENEEDQIHLADAFKAKGDISSARLQLEGILRRKPDHVVTAIRLADILLEIGELDKMAELIDESLRLAGKNEALIEKRRYVDELKFERQIREMELYVTTWPDVKDQRVEIDADGVKIHTVQSPEFQKMLSMKEKLQPDRVRFELGNLFYHSKKYDSAISEYQKLSRQDSKLRYEATYQIGLCFVEKNFMDLAKKQFSQLPFQEPIISEKRRKEMLYNIANIFEDQDMMEEASEYLKQLTLIDINYLDVSSRLEKITEHIAAHRTMMSEITSVTSEAANLSMKSRYRDLKELGKGGMGIVYEALDTKLNRKVALKVLHSNLLNNKEALTRFLREAQAAGSLSHPNIVGVFDVEEEGIIYIAMELVEGKTLKALIRKGITVSQAAGFALQIAEGLRYAHGRGIIHRDIKPENVMITEDGKAKIADFGLARMEELEADVTTAGTVVGTRYFMSPEQIQGLTVGKSSDTYSLGVSMYQMVTGKLPFETGDIAYHHIHTVPKSPIEIDEDIPAEFNELILSCMSKDSSGRPTDDKLVEQLKKLI